MQIPSCDVRAEEPKNTKIASKWKNIIREAMRESEILILK